MSTQGFTPESLDIAGFARADATLEGATPLSRFHRLPDSLHPDGHDAQSHSGMTTITWRATGYTTQPTGGAFEVRLRLEAKARLPLTCQLCLNAVETPTEVARKFQFVANESQAAALDEDSEDDILVLSRHFDLFELIEDEMLLALPLVPQHDICPKPLALPQGLGEFDEPQEPAHPFAELEQLKSFRRTS